MSSDSIYRLPAVMDIAATIALRRYFLDVFAEGSHAQVDASAVERVSTSGLQCLLSAQASFGEAGKVFAITNPAPSLLAAAADMGFDDLLKGKHL